MPCSLLLTLPFSKRERMLQSDRNIPDSFDGLRSLCPAPLLNFSVRHYKGNLRLGRHTRNSVAFSVSEQTCSQLSNLVGLRREKKN